MSILVFSFISFLIGTAILKLLSILFRYKRIKSFFKLRIDLLFVNFLTQLVLITNPVQNEGIIFILLAISYLVLCFMILKYRISDMFIKIGDKKTKFPNIKIKRNSLGILSFLVLILFFLIFGKGDLIDGVGYKILDNENEISMNEGGNFAFATTNLGIKDVGVIDSDNDGNYETMKYDLNKDGKTDLIEKVDATTGEVSESEFFGYNNLKIFLIIATVIYLLLIITIKKIKEEAKLKPLFPDKKDIENVESKNIKHIGEPEIGKETSENIRIEGDKNTEDEINQNRGSNDNNDGENNNTNKNISKFILVIFSISTILSSFVNAVGGMPDINSLTNTYKECVQDPFNDSKCTGIDSEQRIFLQHFYSSDLFRIEYVTHQQKYAKCSYNPTSCDEQTMKNAQDEMIALWDKWKNKKPIKPADFWDNSGNNNNGNNINENGEEDNNEGNGNINNNETDSTINDSTNTSTNNTTTEDDTNTELFPPDEQINIGDIKNTIFGEKKEPKKKLNETEIKQIAEKSVGNIKTLTKISSEYIKELNNSDLKNQLKNIANELKLKNKINQENITQLKGQIEKRNSKTGLKVDDLVADLDEQIELLEKNNFDFNEADELKKLSGKFQKMVDGVGKIGDTLDLYQDYRDFQKKYKNDTDKVIMGTLATTFGKKVVGSNPVDLVTGITGGTLKMIGFEKEGEMVSKISAGDVVKDSIYDAYDTDEETFGEIFQRQKDIVDGAVNGSNYNSVEKVGVVLNATATTMYGGGVYVLKKGLKYSEPFTKAFVDGTKEIGKWWDKLW